MKNIENTITFSATDLVGHLNCSHLTACDLNVANGKTEKPKVWDPLLEVLWERGSIHEEDYIRHLKDQGFDALKIEGFDITEEAVEQTKQAMKSGAKIIVQGALSEGRWRGRADILRRVEKPSDLGSWSYEVIDTKLARETKGGTVLQLCLYSELLFNIQGTWPEYMYVVVPCSDFEPIQYRVMDYVAYFRYVKNSLEKSVDIEDKSDTYPEPKSHCDVCRWGNECDKKRREDDHLCLVANISKGQINELKKRSVETVADLAKIPLPIPWKPERGSVATYERIREQARVQVEGREAGKCTFEILPIEEGFGFNCLPVPSAGDIFFDIEGDTSAGESGMEYLFGYQYKGEAGDIEHVADWALSHVEEKRMFETFVDFVMKRWEQYPDLHIYHYAPYEPSALKRLMGRYATKEEEIDQMLRAGLFVDLYSIVRHSIRASVESYSIKKLEPFYGFTRDVSLSDANSALYKLQTRMQLGDIDAITDENKETVAGYNRDDCASTLQLRDWLEKLRTQCISEGIDINRPELGDSAPSENISEWLERINPIIDALTVDVPVDEKDRNDEQQARWILANVLDWHRREEKAVWWEYFRLRELSAENLLDEKKGLAGLTFIGDSGGTAKAPIHKYKFRPQESDLRGGEDLSNLGGDKLGKIETISFEEDTIEIKKRGDSKDIHPEAVFSHNIVPSGALSESLVRLGEWVASNGIMCEGSYKAARDLLLKREPRISEGNIRDEGETTLDAAMRVALNIDGGIFPIQGPPGTGKTHTGARMICALVQQGKKVGITANSHKVIRNIVDKAIELAAEENIDIKCILKAKEAEDNSLNLIFAKNNNDLFARLKADCSVAGGTAWLWSREEAFEAVDILFVDEAAQMSLANVLAVSQAGKTVILLGDPQQLDQPMQGSHPEGTDISALDHILDGHQTIPMGKGLFLDETWRLHPRISSYTSDLFYEGKLQSRKGLEQQKIISSCEINGAGLFYVPVSHAGNQSSSNEEAVVIERIVKAILDSGSSWINWEGKERTITLEDILIITPYNAQVFEIQQHLAGARIGTVDKFQGQEAPITIYSMATSSYEDAPRGMNFLYNLNRLNVATSRSKCISILVCSPKIFEPDCKTPEQIRLANAFCRYLEVAEEVRPAVFYK
ncbi:MAG: TM0106 family RecB-like putative nuclease [Candidatus Omnitrophica bacterium]|nr:TM0106 family RecB-like putative nuclease [Candidatus Omnitrophota bacterium]